MNGDTSLLAISSHCDIVSFVGENLAKEFPNTDFVINNQNICHECN